MTYPHSKISTLLLSLIIALSACAPSTQRASNQGKNQEAGIINGEDQLPPVVEQDLVSNSENFQKLLEEKGSTATDYETPTQSIKNGEDIVYVGYTTLKNIKSVFNRNSQELEVSGLAEIMNADKKTIRVSQAFKIKGKYKAKNGNINLRPVDEEKNDNGVQVRAVVTCLKSDLDNKYDCGRAIIDLFIKHQNNYYTEQLESTAFEKPKMTGGKEPGVKVEITEPEIQNPVKVTPDQTDEAKKPVIETKVLDKPAVSETTVVKVIDETKEEADGEAVAEVEEGDDGAIQGRYEGKAALVKLAQLFLTPNSSKQADSADEDDDEDKQDQQAVTPDVKKDLKGRLVLTNQAVGSPDEGRLRNASFLKTHLETYNLTHKISIANSSAKNYYGTQEMMNVLEVTGDKAYSFQRNKIHISRISAKSGGRLPPSVSHQNGMDVDIGYPTVNGKVGFPIVASGGSMKKSDFSTAKTLELFKFIMTQTVSPVDRLFVDQAIINKLCKEAKETGRLKGSERAAFAKLFENLQHVDGHGNHFHMRLRCTPNQPDCRHKIYKKMNNCSI
ncbi:MAG: penicillin-insensitive murein endopeptidase [Bdellovibrionota bacterium]